MLVGGLSVDSLPHKSDVQSQLKRGSYALRFTHISTALRFTHISAALRFTHISTALRFTHISTAPTELCSVERVILH